MLPESILKVSRRPVLFFANGIGDNLLNLPALRGLRSGLGQKMVLICEARRKAFFEELETPILGVEMTRHPRGFEFDWRALRDRIAECDLFISLSPWMTPSLHELIRALQPVPTIGFGPEFDQSILRGESIHALDAAFTVCRFLFPHLDVRSFCQPPRCIWNQAEEIYAIRKQLPSSSRILVVHIETLPHKCWPTNHWKEALARFLNLHPDIFALVIGDKAKEVDSDLPRLIPSDTMSLPSAMTLVATADYFAGIDSCMLHVADFARVPSVALFGPTSHQKWGIRFASHVTLQGNGDMESITIPEVVRALTAIVSDTGCKMIRSL